MLILCDLPADLRYFPANKPALFTFSSGDQLNDVFRSRRNRGQDRKPPSVFKRQRVKFNVRLMERSQIALCKGQQALFLRNWINLRYFADEQAVGGNYLPVEHIYRLNNARFDRNTWFLDPYWPFQDGANRHVGV